MIKKSKHLPIQDSSLEVIGKGEQSSLSCGVRMAGNPVFMP